MTVCKPPPLEPADIALQYCCATTTRPDTHPPTLQSALQEHAARYAQEITELLSRMPRVLLLLLKTNDCLRCG